MQEKKLIELAQVAKNNAYVPYSKFSVGAAVEVEDGEIFTGCNIENAAYGPSVCAERVAIFKAVSAGYREIKKIAIVAGDNMSFPCGVCRQVLQEFGQRAEIIVAKDLDHFKVFSIEELLPYGFGPEDLEEVENV